MKKQPKYSPEVIERAVRMVDEAASEYSTARSGQRLNPSQPRLAAHLKRLFAGYASKSAIAASGQGRTTAEEERIKALEREVRELRKANEILRLASAFFAQAELDRRFKS